VNTHLLVSDADHFRVDYEINPYMSTDDQPDHTAAVAEHDAIVAAHRGAGRTVERLASAPECPDMVFTANAALVSGRVAVLGNLPEPRRPETPHHRAWLHERGYDVLEAPYRFSGQGDALPCGELLWPATGSAPTTGCSGSWPSTSATTSSACAPSGRSGTTSTWPWR
jgi:N-dimethylarginine dimethylaminohydrolase